MELLSGHGNCYPALIGLHAVDAEHVHEWRGGQFTGDHGAQQIQAAPATEMASDQRGIRPGEGAGSYGGLSLLHAALVYTGTAYREEPEPAFVGVMSSVYVWADDAWRLALYQQTPIPASSD